MFPANSCDNEVVTISTPSERLLASQPLADPKEHSLQLQLLTNENTIISRMQVPQLSFS